MNCNRTGYNTTSTPSFIQINASDFLQELPNNQYNESAEWRDYGIDMSGNVLLLHFDNDSAYRENHTLVYDYSSAQKNGTCANTDCPISNTTAQLGKSAHFAAGADNYNLSTSSKLDFSDDFKLSVLNLQGFMSLSVQKADQR